MTLTTMSSIEISSISIATETSEAATSTKTVESAQTTESTTNGIVLPSSLTQTFFACFRGVLSGRH